MTSGIETTGASQGDETKALLTKVFDKLLALEDDIRGLRSELQEIKTTQEEVNKKTSTWDARLWALSLTLIGGAMTAFIAMSIFLAGIVLETRL